MESRPSAWPQTTQFDLLILDLNLPGTGGLDVLRNIRSRKPDLPVMVMTGSSVVEERVRGLDAGAEAYVAKPFAFAELAARIRAVLRGEAVPPILRWLIWRSIAWSTPCSVMDIPLSSARKGLRYWNF